MSKTTGYTQNRQETLSIVVTAMLISLVFISTVFLNIKLPIKANDGLVHLGTATLFIASILYGPKKGAVAGAIGMGLFDLVGGWLIWAPITIVSRGIQGFIVGKIAWAKGKKGNHLGLNIIGMVISMPIMISIYYLGEVILYSSWIAPLASIPGDIIQNVLGLIVAIPVCLVLRKTKVVEFGNSR